MQEFNARPTAPKWNVLIWTVYGSYEEQNRWPGLDAKTYQTLTMTYPLRGALNEASHVPLPVPRDLYFEHVNGTL